MTKGWQTKTLGDTCEMYQPKTISGKEMVADGAYVVFGANGVIGRYDKFNHEEPQLLITCRGATCGSVNMSEPNSWITGNAMVVRPKDGAIELSFLEYLFRGGIDIARAITGAAQPQITRTNLAPLEISYPESLAEQQRIVGILDEAFEGIATAKANAEKNLQNARALFESHLQSVFTDLRDAYPSESLKSLCERITKGSSPKWQGIEYVNSPGILFVTSENVRENRLVIDPPKYVEAKFNLKERRSILESGDVLTNLVGASIGRTAVYDREPGANINQAVGLIRCVPDRLCNYYVMYYLNSPVMKDFLHANEVNNARANISLAFVSELNIPLPSLAFQTELVGRIREMENETQRLATIYERKLAALDDLKKSLLHQAFSGNL